jgi:hypothetical protein
MVNKIKEHKFKRVFDDVSKKWNLQNTETGINVLEQWYDNLGAWSSFSSIKGKEHDVFGWDGLIFLESPIKTDGAYPYGVKAQLYHYSSDGELLESIDEIFVGLNGIDDSKYFNY